MLQQTYITNKDLNALLIKGHQHAFEVVYKLYYEKLLHIAKSYLVYKEDAEGVVQNVFLKLWEQMDRIDEISNLNAYLFTLVKNNSLDAIKHKNVKLKFIEQKKAIIQMRYINDSTEALLLENELEKRILEAIEKLPQKCKEVFVESRFYGRKNREIAEMYAISKRTVDNHITNGIRLMRLHLKDFITIFILVFLK